MRLTATLDDRFYRYRLVEATRAEVPLEILLAVGRFDAARLDTPPPGSALAHCPDCNDPDCRHPHHGHRTDHSQVFTTWSYEAEAPLSMDMLREATSRLPASIYRCKGVVRTSEVPGRRVILQVVGKRVDIAIGDEWNGREARTRIVAIGAHDGVNGASLREVFDKCRGPATRPEIIAAC